MCLNVLVLLVDAFSKYERVHRVNQPDAQLTVKPLRKVFAHFGLPHQIVFNYSRPFIAEDFQNSLQSPLRKTHSESALSLAEETAKRSASSKRLSTL